MCRYWIGVDWIDSNFVNFGLDWIGFVGQGMNELLAPLYYLCCHEEEALSLHPSRMFSSSLFLTGLDWISSISSSSSFSHFPGVFFCWIGLHCIALNGTALSSYPASFASPHAAADHPFFNAEADAFTMFTSIMSDLRDRFLRQLDNAETVSYWIGLDCIVLDWIGLDWAT